MLFLLSQSEPKHRARTPQGVAWYCPKTQKTYDLIDTPLRNPDGSLSKLEIFHDVTERKWALKAIDGGVDGLICVNADAGGHAGTRTPEALFEELGDLGLPLICAGGIGDEQRFVRALDIGYAGAQLGSRFIATAECTAHGDYKRAPFTPDESPHMIWILEKVGA